MAKIMDWQLLYLKRSNLFCEEMQIYNKAENIYSPWL